MRLTQCLLDVEMVEGESESFSVEYVAEGGREKLIFLLPFCIVQLTTRWEKNNNG